MVLIDLLQPRHNYAPQEGLGHIYLPTSLLTAGARLLHAGVKVKFHDENLAPADLSSRYVGVNLIGSAYIPEMIKLQGRIVQEIGEDPTFLLGGRVVDGLTPSQFDQLFGDSYNGNNDEVLTRILGINPAVLPSPEKTSLIPAYQKLDDKVMKKYLEQEISLYVSQGCKFSCNFCAAVRTVKDPFTGKVTKIKESYRDPSIIHDELDYLVSRAEKLDLHKLQIYLSNLDLFQTPSELLKFAQAVKEVKNNHHGFDIQMRALSTVDSFLEARDSRKSLLSGKKVVEEMIEAGLEKIGFGIDGMTPAVWNAIKKGHNSQDACIEAIRSSREDFGLTPETLMVFGHEGIDTEETLALAYQFTLDMVDRFGAIPRPHVAKAFIPGNDGWNNQRYATQIQALLDHPESFQSLDFTALPSLITHPNPALRDVTTGYFMQICDIPSNKTLYVKPITPELTPEEADEVKRFNQGRYDL